MKENNENICLHKLNLLFEFEKFEKNIRLKSLLIYFVFLLLSSETKHVRASVA
jgi:hypothetical protein